ncbi:MAG: aminodeoxychorismate lyase, partial [Altererythrobacter sp.]|nr:aminodeoxychorismate lyase [Altererythrobacter sp.]
MKKLGCLVAALTALLLAGLLAIGSFMGEATIVEDTAFIIPAGSSLTAVANKLEEQGLISSADGFLLNAKLFGGGDAIQAGEFELTAEMSQADILSA